MSGPFQAEQGHFLSRETLQTCTVKAQSQSQPTAEWERVSKDSSTLLPVGALEDLLGHSSEWLPGSLWSLSGSLESAGRQCLEQLLAARSLRSSDVAGSRSGPQCPVCPGQGWCGPSWSPSEGAGGREAGAGGLRAAPGSPSALSGSLAASFHFFSSPVPLICPSAFHLPASNH